MREPAADAPAAGTVRARLRIIATTDLHAQILPYDYYVDAPTAPAGLAILAGQVRRLRLEVPGAILVDNGDFLQGNPMADWAAREGAGRPHPVAAAMNALGYDAGTLGNHEFNYGLDFLDRVLGQLWFPVVSANVTRHPSAGPRLCPPWVILDREVRDEEGQHWPLRIGVIGVAPPQIRVWERLSLGDTVQTRDILEAVREHLPQVRAAGADIVVVLCHSGIDMATPQACMENAALSLAEVEGIDALVIGHTHGVFPGPTTPASETVDPVAGTLHGKPAVMAGALGSHLGVIDLTLEQAGGRWRSVGHEVAVIAAAGGAGTPDPAVAAAAEASHMMILEQIRRPIGRTPRPIDSHFALVRADESLQVVADAQAEHARRVLAGTEWERIPLLSAVAPYRAGGRAGPYGYVDIPAGPLSMRHAAELYVFPNTICVIETDGAALAAWLDHAARLFLTVRKGVTDQPLIDLSFPGYNFDVLFGLTYRIDPSVPPHGPRRRVDDIRWQGKLVTPDQKFAVVTNSYRAGGAGGFEGALDGARVIHSGPHPVRDVVIEHLRRMPPQPAAPVWRFATLPDTAAWFDTAPAAWADRAAGLDLVDRGIGEGGFRRFSLRFGDGPNEDSGRDRQPAAKQA